MNPDNYIRAILIIDCTNIKKIVLSLPLLIPNDKN